MGFNFPSSPSIGQTFPVPPITNVPVYTWDGEKWTMPGTPSVPAATFDAMSHNGMQINGSIDVSQEFGATTQTLTSGQTKYVCDGFVCSIQGAGSNISAGPIASLPGFPNCILFANTSNNTLGGAGDYQIILQRIEGYRWARLAFGTSQAQPVTIGFWTWTTVAGTMAVSVGNGSRSYVVDVPLLAGGVGGWQYKTVTIPGDVTGTWNTSNGIGAIIVFCYGSGSAAKGAANTWVATNLYATSATTNFFAAPGQIYLSGVIVLPGTQTLSAAQSPNIMRPYTQELPICKRYLTYVDAGFQGILAAGSQNWGGYAGFPVDMRAVPTMTDAGHLLIYKCQQLCNGKRKNNWIFVLRNVYGC